MLIIFNGEVKECHRCGSTNLEILNPVTDDDYLDIWCNCCQEGTLEDVIKADEINNVTNVILENEKLKDINGIEILEGSKLVDYVNNKYLVISKDGELYAKSLFEDCGCGEYYLHQDRIRRNEFKIVD